MATETRDLSKLLESSLLRFGISLDMLEDYKFDYSRKKFICIHKMPEDFDTQHTLSVGIPFLRHRMAHPKLTTAGAMLLGGLATKNIVNLSAEEASAFLRCELMNITNETTQDCDSKGFVIARCDGITLGLGFHEVDDEGRWLKGLFPARWRKGVIMPFSI